jgi:NADP-reducing hydrogenase subunit HndC
VHANKFRVVVCRGPECGEKRCSRTVYEALAAAIAARGLDGSVRLDWQSCFGRCTQGPNVLVREEADASAQPRFVFATAGRGGRSALYNGVSPHDALELIDEHVVRGRLVRRLIEPPARTQSRLSEES